MERDRLPAEVRGLAQEHLETNTDVDVLLLMHRRRDRGWTPGAVAGELRIHPDQAERILSRMSDSGLVECDAGGYRYAPEADHLAAAVDALAALHPSYRVAIAGLIFGRPKDSP